MGEPENPTVQDVDRDEEGVHVSGVAEILRTETVDKTEAKRGYRKAFREILSSQGISVENSQRAGRNPIIYIEAMDEKEGISLPPNLQKIVNQACSWAPPRTQAFSSNQMLIEFDIKLPAVLAETSAVLFDFDKVQYFLLKEPAFSQFINGERINTNGLKKNKISPEIIFESTHLLEAISRRANFGISVPKLQKH